MQRETKRVFEFGPYRLDAGEKILWRDSETLPVTPKSIELLTALVENSGRVLEKKALMEMVWPDTFVEEGNLAKGVFFLRKTLGEGYIETFPKRGYRFVAPLREIPNGGASVQQLPAPARAKRPYWRVALGLGVVATLAGLALLMSMGGTPKAKSSSGYVQLTNFTDPVTGPVLSPDGRMLAFFRSDRAFLTKGQIYLKLLPNGEPFPVTNDSSTKLAPVFSPDGSRLAYTRAVDGWNTWTVPLPAGGEPRLMLPNAAGLTWIGDGRILFSEIKKGMHMGIVTATESRAESRDVYLPEHERAMAHYSYLSPDRKWVLIVEMDRTTAWQPCRLVPFDGSSMGRQVGPAGACTSAAWSPDGRWMYFSALVDGNSHLWRQRFSGGAPEQFTFGPTEESGVAVAPDGGSVISSVGLRQSAIWLHDAQGERQISPEGYAEFPTFSHDGNAVYYLLRRESLGASNELWRTDLTSGRNDRLLPGLSIGSYQISPNGKDVVVLALTERGKPEIWLGSLDRRSPPKRLTSPGDLAPGFGPNGELIFSSGEGRTNYLYRMRRDGSGREKIVLEPISTILGRSPDGRWIVALQPVPDGGPNAETVAISTDGGSRQRICPGFCPSLWSPDGKFFFIRFEPADGGGPFETLELPIQQGRSLPDLPADGIRNLAAGSALPGARIFKRAAFAPGIDPSTYVYVKASIYRNLFRIPLP